MFSPSRDRIHTIGAMQVICARARVSQPLRAAAKMILAFGVGQNAPIRNDQMGQKIHRHSKPVKQPNKFHKMSRVQCTWKKLSNISHETLKIKLAAMSFGLKNAMAKCCKKWAKAKDRK